MTAGGSTRGRPRSATAVTLDKHTTAYTEVLATPRKFLASTETPLRIFKWFGLFVQLLESGDTYGADSILPAAQALRVEIGGTKKYSPPREVTKNCCGTPGGSTASRFFTRAKPETEMLSPL